MRMLDKLHAANPLHLSVVDDHKHMDLWTMKTWKV